MQGTWNHGQSHYRCVFATNYAASRAWNHPKAVYVKESAIVPKLDEWLASLFDPENLDVTCRHSPRAGDPTTRARPGARKRPGGSWRTVTGAWPSTGSPGRRC